MSDDGTPIGFTNHARNSKHPEFWTIIGALFSGAALVVGLISGKTADELVILVPGIGICVVVFTKVIGWGFRLIITAFVDTKGDYQNK